MAGALTLAQRARRTSTAVRVEALPTSITEVEALEASLLASGLAEEQDVRHYHGDGVYVRELVIPARRLCIGMIHKYRHVSIMLTGKMMMWTSERGAFLAEAPFISVTPAGCKRAGYALSEVRFVTAHGTPEWDDWEPCDATIRATLAAPSLAEYEAFCKQNFLLESQDRNT